MTLEVSCAVSEVDPARWVDPKVLEQCGITGAEAEAMLNPAPCVAAASVAQPQYNPAVPNMAYPPETLKMILATPDAAITTQGSYNAPPVEV